jgi:tetratricopeptide (TPR) repeat protein
MSKVPLRRIAGFTVAVFMAATSAFAQGAHTLQGRVLLPNGSVPSNPVKVTLTFNGVPVYETFTDLSGRFSFSGLQRGRYRLTAEGDGQNFETTRVEAEVSAFGAAPQTFTQNIQLRLKAGQPIPPAAVTSVEAVDPNLPAHARAEYDKGIKDAGNNKPENAVKHFQEAIAAHPPFYLAHVAIAEQYVKLKRDQEAVEAYRKAIELKPDRAPAYVGLGVLMVKQQKYREALAPLRRSLEIEKQSSMPYLFLGLAEMMTGDYQASESDLLHAYEIGKPALAHIYLANLYDLKGEPARAIDHLKAFLKENPNLPEARQTEIREVIEKLRKQMAAKK